MASPAESIVDLRAQDELPSNRRERSFVERHGLLVVCLSPVLANVIGSLFNIFYNRIQTEPMLSVAQQARFDACVQVFNVIVYPIAIVCFALPLVWLRPIHKSLLDGEPVERERLVKAQRIVVNLPWWFLTVTALGWWSCIPVFPAAIQALPEPLSGTVVFHLVSSFLIASMIAIPQSFFAVEMASQKALFPVFFRRDNPATVPGGKPLNMVTRGLMWVVSTVVFPNVSLVLLLLDKQAAEENPLFGVAVAVISIVYALVTGWMIIKLVNEPVRQLRHAAMQVAQNNLDIRVNLTRADEFGHLIERMNLMIAGLREREALQETFGRHVGREAAKQIMQQESALVGAEQTITAMFVDVRNFTEHSSRHTPQEVVTVLNIFFREAVDRVESHGGMVNKFLGDGFMALFGIGVEGPNHAQQAVDAGLAMLACVDETAAELEAAGWPELAIGIGINTGPAIVGSIGSPKRQEYTAIGDTINVASRVESLTKSLGHPLLVTETTHIMLDDGGNIQQLPPQPVKGKGEPLRVFAIES